jgi:hypothetical protein
MPSDSTSNLKEYYVLLMAAASLGPIEARNEHEAVLAARSQANEVIDPKEIIWMVKNVSDLPFEIAPLGTEEPPEETKPEPPRIVTL